MDTETHPTGLKKTEFHGSFRSYLTGFILCLLLSFSAYFLVTEKLLSGWSLTIAISALAIIQVFVQLIFFLHLGEEPAPKWNLMVFLFMLSIVLVIVIGNLWIMYNLDYNMMIDMTMKEAATIKQS